MRVFLILCAFGALAPLVGRTHRVEPEPHAFPGWPASFEGKALTRLPAMEGDAAFVDRFDGVMARFQADDVELVLRWTSRFGTGLQSDFHTGLHSGRHCYRGLGYRIFPEPAYLDADGQLWSSFRATRGAEDLLVRECVRGADGQSWPEVSAWFWDALRGRTTAPWWSALVVERME